MAKYHRVLWSEGLFLTQHHLQQFDRYHAEDRAFLARALHPFYWGASHIVIDLEGVKNGLFAITEFDGVLPDGTTVRAPLVDDPPASRSFAEHFGPTQETLSVYLALPHIRAGAPGVSLDDSNPSAPTRYQQAFTTVTDEVTGESEREIPYTKKRLTILFSGEDIQGFDALKIAEVERSPEGVTQLRDRYVPPCLSISASHWLTNQVRTLLQTATAKSSRLADNVRQRTPMLTEFSTSDLPTFFKLHTVNAYLPGLNHLHNNMQTHPVHLFEHLSQFAGHLTAFKVGERPTDLPSYQHDNLAETFATLIEKLRELLELDPASRCVKIPLKQVQPSRFEGAITDKELLDTCDFYLGVAASLAESAIANEFPKHAKVISPELLERLVGSAIPGANLIYVQLPPSAIPRKAGKVYFRVDSRGDRWEYIKKAAKIAIYAPPQTFPELEIDCLAVER